MSAYREFKGDVLGLIGLAIFLAVPAAIIVGGIGLVGYLHDPERRFLACEDRAAQANNYHEWLDWEMSGQAGHDAAFAADDVCYLQIYGYHMDGRLK
jgi:hypothetical protein